MTFKISNNEYSIEYHFSALPVYKCNNFKTTVYGGVMLMVIMKVSCGEIFREKPTYCFKVEDNCVIELENGSE